MSNPAVNVPYTERPYIAVLEDDAGSQIIGATWDVSTSLDNDQAAPWPVTPTIGTVAGTNLYYLDPYTFDALGTWLLVATPNGDTERTVRYSFTVTDPAAQAQTIADAVLAASVTGYGANTLGGKIARIGTLNVVTGPVDPMSADRTIIYGDEETLTWSNDTWSIAADATIQMSAYYAGVTTLFAGTRVNATTVSVALTAEQTGALIPGRNHYRYFVKANADVLVAGNMSVERS